MTFKIRMLSGLWNMETGVYHLKKGKSQMEANYSKPGKYRKHPQASRAQSMKKASSLERVGEGRGQRTPQECTECKRVLKSGQDFFNLFGNKEIETKHTKATAQPSNVLLLVIKPLQH